MLVSATGPEHARIFIVGEAPGADEERVGQPFVGMAGRILTDCLTEAGIKREDCRISNVVTTRPPNNNFDVFYEGKGKKKNPTPELVRERNRLSLEIAACQPNVIIALGAEALKALTQFSSITNYRGSIIASPHGKVVPAYHPAYILRDWTARPVLVLDLKRALRESAFPEVKTQDLRIRIHPSKEEIKSYCEKCRAIGELSFDIETESDQITCIGFSCESGEALTIPFWFGSSGSLWPEEDEKEIWKLIKELLENETIKKIAQNGTYDCDVLKRVYGIDVKGFEWDTMLMSHTLQPELPKGLDFLSSIYTDIPYYKDKIHTTDMQEYFEYNAKDALTTYQIYQAQRKELRDANLEEFYRKHVHSLIDPLARMVEWGVKFDVGRKEAVKQQLESEVVELQERLDADVGHTININSSKQMQEWLYGELKLPVKKKLRKGRAEPTVSTDAETLEALYAKTQNQSLRIVLDIREKKKIISTYLSVKLDNDKRIRCSYNIAGTETGRLSSSATARGTGTNLQNIPGGVVKSLFISDEGFTLINADLSQAEARVVAYLAEESRLIQVFESGGDIHRKNAATIYGVPESSVSQEQRSMAKRIVHASNYGMGPRTFAKNAGISEKEAERLLRLYFATYPRIKLWHQRTADQLRRTRCLRNPFGRRRVFWNRWDDSLVKEGLAFIPQSTVADSVNLAIINLSNRLKGRNDIRLLLQVHDSIVAEAEDGILKEACDMIKREMLVPIKINGSTFTIPVDVKVGKDWENMVKV